jgi:hypothetical protein
MSQTTLQTEPWLYDHYIGRAGTELELIVASYGLFADRRV